jgi:hypothetical protein
MAEKEVYTELEYTEHTQQKRSKMAMVILNEPSLIAPLLAIVSKVHDPISYRASWILESVIRKDVSYLFPHLYNFTTVLEEVRHDSVVRPMAKICELLISSYYSKTLNKSQHYITKAHLERITAACFDWLIGDYKVAAEAYSMTALLLLGQTFDWIHPELQLILEQNYATGSAAYKARARMTLKKISALK